MRAGPPGAAKHLINPRTCGIDDRFGEQCLLTLRAFGHHFPVITLILRGNETRANPNVCSHLLSLTRVQDNQSRVIDPKVGILITLCGIGAHQASGVLPA